MFGGFFRSGARTEAIESRPGRFVPVRIPAIPKARLDRVSSGIREDPVRLVRVVRAP